MNAMSVICRYSDIKRTALCSQRKNSYRCTSHLAITKPRTIKISVFGKEDADFEPSASKSTQSNIRLENASDVSGIFSQIRNVRSGAITFDTFKEKYIRPIYLPASFLLGALIMGLRVANDNFDFAKDPASYIGSVLVSGGMAMAMAWVLFDFTDDPPSGGNFSSPR